MTMRTPVQTPLLVTLVCLAVVPAAAQTTVVDTGQTACYDDDRAIACPQPGEPFYGQDAHYQGVAARYVDHGDGTVTDLATGLMWQQSPDLDRLSTHAEAVAGAAALRLAGHDDWRLPTIKELYSLIDFRGSSQAGRPYIDTEVFDFRFGDPGRGERLIDAQTWSATLYVGTVFGDQEAAFGVNFADGRIKAYPTERGRRGRAAHFVRYVRGNREYGCTDLVDNGDGTVTDRCSGLTWMQADAGAVMTWEEALAWSESLVLAGHDDWRLPNAKELQSIVDYGRAPDAPDPALRGPAIDPLFQVSEPESWYWSSTTHLEAPPGGGGGSEAVYVAFGQAFGVLGSGNLTRLVDVHGAGAQRSDPKSGHPGRFTAGRGPQHDQVRILNAVRCVRGGVEVVRPAGEPEGEPAAPAEQPSPGAAADQGGAGRQGAHEPGPGLRSQGPAPCSTQEDCAGACPPEALLGCLCTPTPRGSSHCIPACRSDDDCPQPPGTSLRCTHAGLCVPKGPPPDSHRRMPTGRPSR